MESQCLMQLITKLSFLDAPPPNALSINQSISRLKNVKYSPCLDTLKPLPYPEILYLKTLLVSDHLSIASIRKYPQKRSLLCFNDIFLLTGNPITEVSGSFLSTMHSSYIEWFLCNPTDIH